MNWRLKNKKCENEWLWCLVGCAWKQAIILFTYTYIIVTGSDDDDCIYYFKGSFFVKSSLSSGKCAIFHGSVCVTKLLLKIKKAIIIIDVIFVTWKVWWWCPHRKCVHHPDTSPYPYWCRLLLLLLETAIQYPWLRVYVAQIHIDLKSQFLAESNRRPSY